MGGSMHLVDKNSGFLGSVPIVAATVPIAVGAAEAKLMSKSNVAVVYIGDGAMEEGVVHESLNLAKMMNLPIIFVVENTFASHMNIKLRQPSKITARFALANKIKNKVVDGNNIIEVAKTAKSFINLSREGKGPFLLEALTYRWFGHVDWREDIDVGINRSSREIDLWKNADPIKRLENSYETKYY